jgi:hypothetical protein
VFLLREGRLKTVADTRGPFVSIGPLGPMMNEAGAGCFPRRSSGASNARYRDRPTGGAGRIILFG